MDEATVHFYQFTIEISTLVTVIGAIGGGIWAWARWTGAREANETKLLETLETHRVEFSDHVQQDQINHEKVTNGLVQLNIAMAESRTEIKNLKAQVQP